MSVTITVASVPVPIPMTIVRKGVGDGRRRQWWWPCGHGVTLDEIDHAAALAGDDGGVAALEGEALPLCLGDKNWFHRMYSVDGARHGST